MAEFHVEGLDELIASMEEISAIPDAVQDEILNAQADVLVKAVQSRIDAYNVRDTGLTRRAIKKGKVKVKKGVRGISVYVAGTRLRGKKTTRNAEIAFVTNFGTRTDKARPFWSDAENQSGSAVTAAGEAIYDKWLQSKNL